MGALIVQITMVSKSLSEFTLLLAGGLGFHNSNEYLLVSSEIA
jgi:hypothetical protein